MIWKSKLLGNRQLITLIAFFFLILFFYLITHKTLVFLQASVSFYLLGIAYLLSLGSLQLAYFCLAFVLPLSIKLESENYGIGIGLPSEVMIALLAIALVFRWLQNGYSDKLFLKHPISRLIYLYVFLTFLSTAFSSMPLISIKASLVRLSYLLVFYFGLNDVFNQNRSGITDLFIKYGYSLFAVALYFLYLQSLYSWNKETAGISVNPFYADHTIFSACAVFILPFFSAHLGIKAKTSGMFGVLFFLILGGLVLAVFFTYSRAAWISVCAALVFLFLVRIKVNSKIFAFLFLISGAILFQYQDEIWISIQENNSISTSPTTNMLEQTQSITNVSTDVSNAERLNRWSCALRMFLDKPFLGFGPGTFQFQYLAYQLPDETTYISVFSPYNIPKGRGGSAHSEYLLVLAECGVFSLLVFILVIVAAIYAAMQVLREKTISNKQMLMAVLIGFFTYCIHAFFNNYLDTDKAAFLFFASLSVIVGESCLLNGAQKKTPEG